ncbi:MAG: DUF63 family protein [Thermoplasmatales archaeon]|nr:MAG: DUF63 family protein [Thermoplasmatales archaeon]
MESKGWFEKNKLRIIFSLLIVVVFIVVAGCILAPSLFYDQWIWKYYWGPIVADANPDAATAIYHGVEASEGYTLVSEITYGIILIIALYAIYKLLKKLKVAIDWRFCLALMPYILFGPVSRVLEDADYFNVPAVYWFISPLIYLQIAAYALFFVVTGFCIENLSKKKKDEKHGLLYSIFLLLGVNVFVTIIWTLGSKYGVNPVELLIFYLVSCAALLPLVYSFLKHKNVTVNTILFSGGLLFLLPGLYLIGRWIIGIQWSDSSGVRFDVFILIMGLVALIAAAAYFASIKYKKIAVYKEPLNITMIVGHMIDGLTSYISIYDPLKMGLPFYVEKHPASNILMEIWPPLFPMVKFLLIIAVIYIFDVLYKEELKNHGTLVNLLKIGILILGLSPGLRDLLRVTMGV